MHPDDLLYPAIWFNDRAYFLTRGQRFNGSHFGGPSDATFEVPPNARIHHVATIGGHCFPPLFQRVGGGDDIHLFYGFCHDGCELQYGPNDRRELKLHHLDPPAASLDSPYPNYPPYLSYFPLELEREIECSLREFLQLSCQPQLQLKSSEALILVPPSPLLGMSLWGPGGDMSCVQIVFRYNYETEGIAAQNQCT